jgi:hypothetical protein
MDHFHRIGHIILILAHPCLLHRRRALSCISACHSVEDRGKSERDVDQSEYVHAIDCTFRQLCIKFTAYRMAQGWVKSKKSQCFCGIVSVKVTKRGRRRSALTQNPSLQNITENSSTAHSYGGVHREAGNSDTSLRTVVVWLIKKIENDYLMCHCLFCFQDVLSKYAKMKQGNHANIRVRWVLRNFIPVYRSSSQKLMVGQLLPLTLAASGGNLKTVFMDWTFSERTCLQSFWSLSSISLVGFPRLLVEHDYR